MLPAMQTSDSCAYCQSNGLAQLSSDLKDFKINLSLFKVSSKVFTSFLVFHRNFGQKRDFKKQIFLKLLPQKSGFDEIQIPKPYSAQVFQLMKSLF
mgnify:CR=1 FL=1